MLEKQSLRSSSLPPLLIDSHQPNLEIKTMWPLRESNLFSTKELGTNLQLLLRLVYDSQCRTASSILRKQRYYIVYSFSAHMGLVQNFTLLFQNLFLSFQTDKTDTHTDTRTDTRALALNCWSAFLKTFLN